MKSTEDQTNKPEDVQNLLQELHTLTVKELLQIVKSGEASSAELRVIKDFLKDNDIGCIPTPQKDMKEIQENLPYKLSEYEQNLEDESDDQARFSSC